MSFIKKQIPLIGILLLTVFVGAAAGLYFDVPGHLQNSRSANNAKQTYTCPMHPDVVSAKPGDCPKCGMALVPAGQTKSAHDQCGESGQNHPGCCAEKNLAQPNTKLKLPPGHPPIPGWTTDTNKESESTPANAPAHSSH